MLKLQATIFSANILGTISYVVGIIFPLIVAYNSKSFLPLLLLLTPILCTLIPSFWFNKLHLLSIILLLVIGLLFTFTDAPNWFRALPVFYFIAFYLGQRLVPLMEQKNDVIQKETLERIQSLEKGAH